MIWKVTIFLTVALCVLGVEHHAVSEHNFKIVHKIPHKDHYHEHHKEMPKEEPLEESKEEHKDGPKENEHHGHHGELAHYGSKMPEHHEAYAWSYPSYEFSYEVNDPHTHDMKGQKESRDGDKVHGMYWLIQPDGLKRTVTYHADKHSGFHAHVQYSDKHDYHHEDEGKKEEAHGEEKKDDVEHHDHEHDDHKHDDHEHEDHEHDDHEHDDHEHDDHKKHDDHDKYKHEEHKEEEKKEEDESRSAEESRDSEEDTGKWIHNRHWGHRAVKHEEGHGHYHKYDHISMPYYMIRGNDKYGHKKEHKQEAEHYSWPGQYEVYESRINQKHRTHPKMHAGPIVREQYVNPRFYRHSELKRKQ